MLAALTNFTRRAPFTYAAWNDPEVLRRISEVAGIDLIPSVDFEIANINISVNSNPDQPVPEQQVPSNDELPAVAWHYDSFPFVCVTMLSDCTGMVGGETALRTPSGDIMKVRGPAMVCDRILPDIFLGHGLTQFVGNCRCSAGTVHRASGTQGPRRS